MKDQQEELELLIAELQLYSFFEEEFLFAMEEIHKRLREIIILIKTGSTAMVLAELEVTRNLLKDAEDLDHKTKAFNAYSFNLDKAIVQTLQMISSSNLQYN